MSDIDPEKLEEAIEDIERLCDHHAGRSLSSLKMGIAAARAHLATLPRYKEVEVWHVEYTCAGKPRVFVCFSRAEADEEVRQYANRQYARVTGPHKQRVPA